MKIFVNYKTVNDSEKKRLLILRMLYIISNISSLVKRKITEFTNNLIFLVAMTGFDNWNIEANISSFFSLYGLLNGKNMIRCFLMLSGICCFEIKKWKTVYPPYALIFQNLCLPKGFTAHKVNIVFNLSVCLLFYLSKFLQLFNLISYSVINLYKGHLLRL